MRLFIFSFVISLVTMSSSYGFSLNCKVTDYELLRGNPRFASHAETEYLYIKLTSEVSAFEREIGCPTTQLLKPHLYIKAYGANKPQDLSFCESQNFLEIDKKSISYSNFNDHDAPEEVLDLFKIGNVYYGKLLSKWDAKESLEIVCQKK